MKSTRSAYKTTTSGKLVGNYPYKVTGFIPGKNGAVMMSDRRTRTPGTIGLKKSASSKASKPTYKAYLKGSK